MSSDRTVTVDLTPTEAQYLHRLLTEAKNEATRIGGAWSLHTMNASIRTRIEYAVA